MVIFEYLILKIELLVLSPKVDKRSLPQSCIYVCAYACQLKYQINIKLNHLQTTTKTKMVGIILKNIHTDLVCIKALIEQGKQGKQVKHYVLFIIRVFVYYFSLCKYELCLKKIFVPSKKKLTEFNFLSEWFAKFQAATPRKEIQTLFIVRLDDLINTKLSVNLHKLDKFYILSQVPAECN